MSQSFIEFFEKLRERPAPNDCTSEGLGRETAFGDDVEEAVDLIETTNRCIDSSIDVELDDQEDLEHQNNHDQQEEEEEQGVVDWDEVTRSTSLGPLLSSLREEQEKQPMVQRETYSVEHLKRLYQFIPKRPYSKPRANKLCSKVHPKPCPYQCKSCHFCRQRTTEPKTICSVCDGVNNYYGGPARGYWCGSCLWLRIGENIDEVRDRTDWVCPACRDICNCSGANCMRIKRGWFPTNQLSHEARDQGYKSVAHYLVLTHLSEQASAAPMELMFDGPVRRRRHRKPSRLIDQPNPDTSPQAKRIQSKLPLQFAGRRTRKQALEMASKPRVQREISDILKDLGSEDQGSILDRIIHQADTMSMSRREDRVQGSLVQKSASKFLCILDQDMKEQDEDEDEEYEAHPKVPVMPEKVSNIRATMYPEGGARQTLSTVTVRGPPDVDGSASLLKVGEQMLPPKQPSRSMRNVRQRTSGARSIRTAPPKDGVSTQSNATGEEENFDDNLDDGIHGREEGRERIGSDISNGYSILKSERRTTIAKSVAEEIASRDFEMRGVAIDEFIWNGLCLRALSIVDAVKTFYTFHPDILESGIHLIDEIIDKRLYDNIYESTLSKLQEVLKSAEALVTEDAGIVYTSSNHKVDSLSYPGALKTVGGVRRAVQLLTYLSRILPEADIKWRIEKRLLGIEPFVDFQTSSPHAKAVILRGRLELIAILEKREMCSPAALENLGNTLGTIAADMKAALPLLDAIIENQAMPMQNILISGWHYDDNTRQRRIVEIFTDLSVLYASLHEVLLLGIQRTCEMCDYIGPKSYHILTQSLKNTLLDLENSFPDSIVRQGFVLVGTMIDLALSMFEDQNINMTVEERNVFLTERNEMVEFVAEHMVPRLEMLVQKDYTMWGKSRQLLSNTHINIVNRRTDSMGSEKVEVLARCYALLLRSERANWVSIESKATDPYSFSQYWKYANLRYRRFSLYLLSHTLERAPSAMEQQPNLPSILRMWLLSVLDFGRHECSWYLTSIIAKHTSNILTNVEAGMLDFRTDPTGRNAQSILRQFGENVMKGQMKSCIAGIVLLLDECLQERQREIIQTSFNANKALLKWQRSTARALLGFLEPLAPVMCSTSLAGKELRKVLRRCAIWTVETFWIVKQRSKGDIKNRSNEIDGEIDVELLSDEGDIRQELELSICSELSHLLSLIDFLRLHSPIKDENAVEFFEPLWILILGVSELGDGGTVLSPFESVMYDKVAGCLFEVKPLLMGAEQDTSSNILCLHHHVLGIHIRRMLSKVNLRHQQSERLGVNAMRFAFAIFSRPEMRSPGIFKAAFDLMMTTWMSILSQNGDSDSLSLKYELIKILKLSIKLHVDMMPGCSSTAKTFGPLYHIFWKVVCTNFLGVLTNRFPESLYPSIAMEAEYIYCQMLPEYPGLELFKPGTPAQLSEAYNHALGELGRPPSLAVLDIIHSNFTLADVIPRVFGVRQSQMLGNFRPGDFGWTVGKSFLSLLDSMIGCTSTDSDAKSLARSPGSWYSLCCLPYLESVYRKGERASLLIEKEYTALVDSLEHLLGDTRKVLAHKQQEPSVAPSFSNEPVKSIDAKASILKGSVSAILDSANAVNELALGTVFSVSSNIVKVRKIEREGVKVAVCSLSDEPRETSSYFNVLVSKPQDLVDLILDPNFQSTLPRKIQIAGIEFVRRKAGRQVAVARSTPTCTMQLSSNEESMSAFTNASNFVEASKRLQSMGYNANVVMGHIKQVQKENLGRPMPSIGTIVSTIIENIKRD